MTSAYGRSYGYDSAGRLTSYEGTSYTAFAAGHPHAVVDVGGATRYTYDANGNMTTRWSTQFNGWQTLTWDHENRLNSVTGAGIDESYLYDGDGQRVRKVGGGVTTAYVNLFYELSGSTVTKYYYFNGQRVAVRQGNNPLYYLYNDHLGSTSFVTHDGGTPLTNQRYYAFGKVRLPGALPTDHWFTGQKYSSGNGLYHYGARYYDPELGRFIQPDTIVPNPGDTQSFDRYAYALNNPLRYSDPTGHYSRDEVIQHFGCAENDWGCVDALFDNSNKDSLYRGAGEWLQILLDAVDGDVVTAWNPNAQAVMTGQFLRNAETGAIGIQMVMSDGQLTGPIHESAFAAYGAGKPYVGGYNYALQSSKYVQPMGQLYYVPGACGFWDCTALGYDVTSLGVSTIRDIGIIMIPETLGVSGIGAVASTTFDVAITTASVAHTYDMLQQGKANEWDVRVQGVTAGMSVTPGWGEIGGITQLLWDIFDPFHP